MCLNHQRVCIPNSLPSSSKWHHWGNSHQKRGPPPGAQGPHIEIAWEASWKSGYFCEKNGREHLMLTNKSKNCRWTWKQHIGGSRRFVFGCWYEGNNWYSVPYFIGQECVFIKCVLFWSFFSCLKFSVSALPCCFQPVVVCHGFVAASISSTHQPLTAVIGSAHLLYMTHFQSYTLQGCNLLLKGSQ